MPPLGYDVKNRKLVVNDAEARTVVDIYRRYLALKSVHALKDELAGAGIKSKRRMGPDGTTYGGQKLSRGALYLMLQNRIYRGEITHQGSSYLGEHPAIIDQPLWDEVQAALAKNRVERATGLRAKHPSLLAGMVFDETGERLTPTYSVKKGTRYRYYVSTSLITGAGRNRSAGRRIPAGNLEGLVINRLRPFFADPAAILDAVGDESHGLGQSQPVERPNGILASTAVGLFVQLVAPWHEHPISTAYLEYDGNSHTVKPSNRLAALAGRRCSHFHPAERGDAFFGRRRGLAPFVH